MVKRLFALFFIMSALHSVWGQVHVETQQWGDINGRDSIFEFKQFKVLDPTLLLYFNDIISIQADSYTRRMGAKTWIEITEAMSKDGTVHLELTVEEDYNFLWFGYNRCYAYEYKGVLFVYVDCVPQYRNPMFQLTDDTLRVQTFYSRAKYYSCHDGPMYCLPSRISFQIQDGMLHETERYISPCNFIPNN